MPDRCGDFGGVTRSGTPCRKFVSSPVRCRDHTEAAEQHIEQQKIAFCAALEDGMNSMTAAALSINVSPVTIWRWRGADEKFDVRVEKTHDLADRMRVTFVEDSLFARIVRGDASAAESIFFLCNRAPHRWRTVQRVTPQFSIDMEDLTEIELRRIITGEDPMIVLAETRSPHMKHLRAV